MIAFDHAVVVVSSLPRAVREFEELGFRVTLGGTTGPVHNALVIFRDGTYVELTTTRLAVTRATFRALSGIGLLHRIARGRDDMLGRFLPWLGAAEGPVDWCIRVDDLGVTMRRLRDGGIDVMAPQAFERTRPDGEVARWSLAGPRDTRLPFFIEDQTPVEVRVPNVDGAFHPNGAEGIQALELSSAVLHGVEAMLGALADEQESSGDLGNVELSVSNSRRLFGLRIFGANDPIDLDPHKTSCTPIRLVR
ncbi:MAG: VOC family protein [Myxococcota bacterium]